MHIIDTIKGWVTFSDTEKVALDRRLFLQGMAATSAGLLVPAATLFDMGRVIVADPSANLDKQRLISEYLKTVSGRKHLSECMTYPLRVRRNYAEIGRKIFQVEELPPGAIPLYDRKDHETLR